MTKALEYVKIEMNDGKLIPGFGLGVYLGSTDEELVETEPAVGFALEQGYRLLDTATVYRNEAGVGHAIKQSGLKREDIFVVTKLSGNGHGHGHCLEEFDSSLKRLDLDYVDLYLIHSPGGGKIVETYDAMLKLREKGVARSIGVSNFNIDMLEGLRKSGRPTPSVNQVELHPYMRRKELVTYCRRNGIQMMAFSPLTKGKRLQEPEMISIAEKYHKSVAQLCIRWCLQCGFITIPKSTKKERIIENCQVFDWSISDEDMAKLDTLPEKTSMRPNSIIYNIHDLKWEDHK